MSSNSKLSIGIFCLLMAVVGGRVEALEILHFIEAGGYERLTVRRE